MHYAAGTLLSLQARCFACRCAHRDRHCSPAHVRCDHVRRSAAAGGRLLQNIHVAVGAVAEQKTGRGRGRVRCEVRPYCSLTKLSREKTGGEERGRGEMLMGHYSCRVPVLDRPRGEGSIVMQWREGRELVVSRKSRKKIPRKASRERKGRGM